jgi:hypothetical protein
VDRSLRLGTAVGLVAAALALSGCSTAVVRRGVERRVERRLTDILGPAEKYRVRIRDTRDPELVQGRARRVEIEGTKIRAKSQILIDSLRLVLVGLRYEGGEPYFVSVERSDLDVEFTDDALNKYLREYHARYDPDVQFSLDRVSVKMVYPFLGKPTTIRATGRLVLKDGQQLLFDADSADVSFLNQPGFGERFVEDRVNPLLDLRRIDFPARLEEVQVFEGRIRAHGSAQIPREVKE